MSQHMNDRHGIQIGIYRQAVASNTIDLLRAKQGYTTTLNQCRWCMETFNNQYIFGQHRNKCDKRPVKLNDRLKEHTDNYTWLVELLKRTL